MQKAAEIAAKDEKDVKMQKEAADMYKEAASYYRANNNPDVAADMFIKAANCNLKVNVDDALACCDEAIKAIEEEMRISTCDEKISKCVALAATAGKYAAAIGFIKRQNVLYGDKDDNSLYKNYLATLVLYFTMEDYKTAEVEYRVWETEERFCSSEYWEPCGALISAYESGDAEGLAKLIKGPGFKYLPNALSRLAAKLKFSPALVEERKQAHEEGEKKDDAAEAADSLS